MKRTIEGYGKIEISNGFMHINEQPIYAILVDNGLKNVNICGNIKIEIEGKEPSIKVEGGESE